MEGLPYAYVGTLLAVLSAPILYTPFDVEALFSIRGMHGLLLARPNATRVLGVFCSVCQRAATTVAILSCARIGQRKCRVCLV